MDFEELYRQPSWASYFHECQELEILEYLLQHEGKGQDPLSDPRCRLEGDGGDSFDRVIDVYIKELRKNWSWTVSLRYAMSAINWRDHDQTGIFAKIFLITFALFSSLVILLHASVYFIFPSTYIESQRQTILKKSQALAKSFRVRKKGPLSRSSTFIPRPMISRSRSRARKNKMP